MIARYLMITAALFTGTYALVSWIGGMLTDAGIAGAFCAALVLIAEGMAYCERRSIERARLAREQVWERRDRVDVTWMGSRQFDELVRSLEVPDELGISLIDTQAAVWDFRNGAPE